MDRDQLIERLMTTFLGELEEHVRTLNDDLMALEKDPSEPNRAERLKTLFRAAHSLKGAARSVGLLPIEDACHAIEELLTELREAPAGLDRDRFALLFATADAIEEAGMRLRERHELAGSPLVEILPRLERAAGTLGAVPIPAPPPAPPPSAPPPPAPRAVEPPPPAPTPEPVERSTAASSYVRVPAEKLDALLTRSGEMLVARRALDEQGETLSALRESLNRWRDEWRGAVKPLGPLRRRGGGFGRLSATERAADPLVRRLSQALARTGEHLKKLDGDLDALTRRMARDRRQLDRAAGQLDEEVRRVRMLPFAEACQGLERTARDVARALGKEVELVIEGGNVELDRSVLEGLKDPLTHLVRNAIDHGIETPERRVSAGKRPVARVAVTAALRGAQVEIVVADDGAGLDFDALRQLARRRGLADGLDERTLADLIFQPGVSTAAIITNISGRGVGLDVVKSRVEALHGTLDLTSEPGRGTRFTLAVPLTLTTLRALLVESGGRMFAIASQHVQRLLRIDAADCRAIEGRPMLLSPGSAPLPIVPLAEALGLDSSAARTEAKRPGLIVAVGDRRAAFVVDRLCAEQEFVVKRLGARLRRVRMVSGASLLPSGKIALVLNTGSLLRAALSRPGLWPSRTPAFAAPSAPARKRLLVVDDSVTTRTLEKSILEAAGYDVTTAVDGEAGWRLLQESGADLLISDVEMPRMDGFALAATVRASPRFAELPIVLFTSRASESDRARGVEVGADAYIVKGAFDQKDLLETVAQLL